jgi:hypothetical protein
MILPTLPSLPSLSVTCQRQVPWVVMKKFLDATTLSQLCDTGLTG